MSPRARGNPAAPSRSPTPRGDLLSVSGRSGPSLEPAADHANCNIFAMASEGLHLETDRRLPSRPQPTRTGRRPPAQGRCPRRVRVGPSQRAGARDPGGLAGSVQHCHPAHPGLPPSRQDPARPVDSHRATPARPRRGTPRSREELYRARETIQGSQEGLNPMNEAMQSTNAELTSSKEELPSPTRNPGRSLPNSGVKSTL